MDILSDGDFAIEPLQGLGERVVEQLRRMIILGALPPGAHLVESQLSSRFQVSRGPIRDALAQLESEGLVEAQRRGVYVRGLSQEDIEELYSLRSSLETMALMRCISNDRSQVQQLVEESLTEMRSAAQRGEQARFARADLAFHTALYEGAQHRRLLSVWRQYEPTFSVLLTITTAEDADLTPSYESHAELNQKISENRTEEALDVLREHLRASEQRMVTAHQRMLEHLSDGTERVPGR